MEREFLNCFYSTRHSVSMLELTSTKQRKDEPVVDYIDRWSSLSLDYKDRVSSFEELTTSAHDKEQSIANQDERKEMESDRRNDKSSRNRANSLKTLIMESMMISAALMKVST
ncbi:unnamed protein product [Prunus armeniaca]